MESPVQPGELVAAVQRARRGEGGPRREPRLGGREQHRVINGGSNFCCLPAEKHFGLAQLESIDRLEIWWPSGATQRVENPPVNKSIRITEGQDHWEEIQKVAVQVAELY